MNRQLLKFLIQQQRRQGFLTSNSNSARLFKPSPLKHQQVTFRLTLSENEQRKIIGTQWREPRGIKAGKPTCTRLPLTLQKELKR